MKKKLLTLFLSVMSVFFVFGAKASAETISVVSWMVHPLRSLLRFPCLGLEP